MAVRGTQLRALFMILLLAGSEAARISERAAFAHAGKDQTTQGQQTEMSQSMSPQEAEKLFKSGNRQCVWSSSAWKCIDSSGQDDAKCEYKAMSKDVTWSESCRLSTAWMLQNDVHHWVTVRVGHLEAKAEKYARDCTGSFGWARPVCWRRAKHLSRGVTFLTEAQEPKYNLPASDKEMIAKGLETVTKALSGSGPNSDRVQKLTASAKEKLAEGGNPVLVLRKTAKVLANLLIAGGESQDEATTFIDNLESSEDPWSCTGDELIKDVDGTADDSTLSKSIDIENSIEQLGHFGEDMDTKLEEAEEQLDKAADELQRNVSNSLVELGQGQVSKAKAFTAWFMAAITIISSVLLFLYTSIATSAGMATLAALGVTVTGPWVVLGLIGYVIVGAIGCGLYTGLYSLFSENAPSWGKCFAKSIALPFMLVGNIFECLASMIGWMVAPKKEEASYFRCQPLPFFSGFWDPRVTMPDSDADDYVGVDNDADSSR